MKTWEVKLLAGNNGVIQTNVEAEEVEFAKDGTGVALVNNQEDGSSEAVAFFTMHSLLSVREVTP